MNFKHSQFLMLLIFLTAFAIAQEIRKWGQTHWNPSFGWVEFRTRELLEKFPSTVKGKKNIIGLFGASEVETGLWPTYIDEMLRDHNKISTTVNFGVRNINISQSAFFDQIIRSSTQNQIRFTTAIVKFNVSRTSKVYRNLQRTQSQKHRFDVLLNVNARKGFGYWLLHPSELNQWLMIKSGGSDDLTNGIYWATEDILFSDFKMDRSSKAKDDTDYSRLYFSLWRDQELHALPAWNAETRGEFRWGLPGSQEVYSIYKSEFSEPRAMISIAKYFDWCCGILNPEFDEELLSEFIVDLIHLRSVSDRVVLLFFSDAPMLNYSDEKQKMIRATLEKLSKYSQAELWNLDEDQLLDQSDYFDPGHLNQ